ncbi:hypothetical protein [Afipia carboxidovorans]|uniref:hypothetical protein n=1 Tax=Afipia carboxidovorans TaxID=40137 RepID=UPI0030CBE322
MTSAAKHTAGTAAGGRTDGCSALHFDICEHGFIARPGCGNDPMESGVYGRVPCVYEKLAFLDHPETGAPSQAQVDRAKARIAALAKTGGAE